MRVLYTVKYSCVCSSFWCITFSLSNNSVFGALPRTMHQIRAGFLCKDEIRAGVFCFALFLFSMYTSVAVSSF